MKIFHVYKCAGYVLQMSLSIHYEGKKQTLHVLKLAKFDIPIALSVSNARADEYG